MFFLQQWTFVVDDWVRRNLPSSIVSSSRSNKHCKWANDRRQLIITHIELDFLFPSVYRSTLNRLSIGHWNDENRYLDICQVKRKRKRWRNKCIHSISCISWRKNFPNWICLDEDDDDERSSGTKSIFFFFFFDRLKKKLSPALKMHERECSGVFRTDEFLINI